MFKTSTTTGKTKTNTKNNDYNKQLSNKGSCFHSVRRTKFAPTFYNSQIALFHPNTTSKIIITQKPIAKEKVERLLCVPRLASGTSSSTTT